MCTVSYIPAGPNNFILTSNRDEKVFGPANAPVIYDTGVMQICYPKDSKAGGSWIAMNNKGRICCLLNGAIEPHQKQDFHTSSRGKIPVELASSSLKAEEYFQRKDLSSVEPFTLLTIDLKENKETVFSEFIWDGDEKRYRELDHTHPYIWSSVTLYSKNDRALRKEWFNRFLMENTETISAKNAFAFHSGKHSADPAINVVMEREGGLRTVSITQVVPTGSHLSMNHSDLIENTVFEVVL